MSKYKRIETTLTDPAALRAAMADLGIPFEFLTVPAALVGYKGDKRPEVAHVIVRRQHIGHLSNDFGLVKGPDGTYQAIISDYDAQAGMAPKLLARITQRYARHRAVGLAASKGYAIESETQDADGTARLTLIKR